MPDKTEPIKNIDSSVAMALGRAKKAIADACEGFIWDAQGGPEQLMAAERAQTADWLETIANQVRQGNLVSFSDLTWVPGVEIRGNLVPVKPVEYVRIDVKLNDVKPDAHG